MTRIPYAPDLRKLDEAFPKLKPGDLIGWEQLAAAAGWGKETPRFKAVQAAWRKRVFRERNVVLIAVAGKGVQVADGSERITHAADAQKSGFRKIARAARVAITTDTAGLPDHLKRTHEHILHTAASIKLMVATKPKELPPLK